MIYLGSMFKNVIPAEVWMNLPAGIVRRLRVVREKQEEARSRQLNNDAQANPITGLAAPLSELADELT